MGLGEIIAIISFLFDVLVNILNGTFKRDVKKGTYYTRFVDNVPSSNSLTSSVTQKYIPDKQAKKIRLRLKYLFAFSQKDGHNIRLKAINLVVNIQKYSSEEKAALMIHNWRINSFVYREGSLTPDTNIVILRKGDLIESVNSFKS